MKNPFNNLICLAVLIITLSCSNSSDDSPTSEPIKIPEAIMASFDYTISPTDAYVLILNNTTTYPLPYTGTWDFGNGTKAITDITGVKEVRYSTAGSYTISLTVSSDDTTNTATKEIIVNDGGICLNAVCNDLNTTGLKDAAKTFSVGTITRSSYISAGGRHTEILKEEFNNLTSEYEMKMNVMYPSQGNYNFSAGDAIVNFAQVNGMNVHGHALIWHNATPSWVENFSGTNAEFESMIEDYITTTLKHYKGKVRSWDVVNEALEDGSGHPLRNSIFRQKMGDNYVKKCFQFARNADPDVMLFYNDYNMASSATKRKAMFNLVDELGDLIDGIGAQMHISYNRPSTSSIQAVADGTVSRGLKLHFAELDIRTNPEKDANVSELSATKASAQKDKFKEVVKIYNAIPLDNKFALTTWGVRDNESWLLDFWGVPDWPLMFDENYNKKAAYEGFLEGLE
ncbi:endo-1,4-beta-xylanase [Algibacter pectinivorans]|uniref:Beta-xylanase n=1 Tax=Algibacter pectinivorans TaxID=870482 RepID=A0A1I1PKY9_9FLAO|nr:endo-1,4-beta-xylanase [Algibacter pectinivorans]SFD10505.1 endo-1,4-beta-xylanase [Algibacter pectinivorans]